MPCCEGPSRFPASVEYEKQIIHHSRAGYSVLEGPLLAFKFKRGWLILQEPQPWIDKLKQTTDSVKLKPSDW